MNFLDQISEALRPHANAAAVAMNAHSNRIVGELQQIRHHMSDLGRGDIDDLWQKFGCITQAADATVHDFLPECRVPINEIWLVQSITAINSLGTTGAVRLLNDSGQCVLALDTATAGDGTVMVSGAVAFMPGEHITATFQAATGVSSLLLQVIRREIPRKSKMPNLGPKSEMLSNKNTHAIDRDFDGITPRTGWQESPPVTVESEGLVHTSVSHARLNGGLLDPTQV